MSAHTKTLTTDIFLTDVISLDKTKNVMSLGIDNFSPSMMVGASQQLSAVGYNDDGTHDVITSGITWLSSDTSVAVVDQTGVLIALGSGISFITISLTTVAYGVITYRDSVNVIALTSSVFANDTTILQMIPVTSEPNQYLSISLNIDGSNRDFLLKIRWNIQAQYWTMTIIDAGTSEYLVDGIPLTCGILPPIFLRLP